MGGLVFFLGNGVYVPHKEFQRDTSLELGLWTSGTTIEQTFVASQDFLTRIDFYVDSYHAWDSPYIECRLFELDTDENPFTLSHERIMRIRKEVRYIRVNGWFISPHMFNSVTFSAIPDSENKRYLFSVQSPELKHGGSSILSASSIERYMYFGNLFVDGERQEGDLAFRLAYRLPRKDLISASIQRIALQKPPIFSSPGTYYLLAGGYLVLLLGLFYFLATMPLGEAKKTYADK